MEILISVKRLCISFKSLVNDFVYSFGRAALLLLLVEVQNHTVPVRERGRIRDNQQAIKVTDVCKLSEIFVRTFYSSASGFYSVQKVYQRKIKNFSRYSVTICTQEELLVNRKELKKNLYFRLTFGHRASSILGQAFHYLIFA